MPLHDLKAGWPPPWARLLSWTWQDQHRWVQIGGHCACEPVAVSTSVPQGCACAPLAIVVLLTQASLQVQELQTPERPLLQTVFVDNRNAVARGPAQAVEYVRRWEEASHALGLRENPDKLRFVCRQAEHEAQLMRLGMPGTPWCLGVDFSRDTSTGPAAARRDKVAEQMVARLTTLPLSPQLKESLFRSQIVPLIAWRAWWVPVDAQTLGNK